MILLLIFNTTTLLHCYAFALKKFAPEIAGNRITNIDQGREPQNNHEGSSKNSTSNQLKYNCVITQKRVNRAISVAVFSTFVHEDWVRSAVRRVIGATILRSAAMLLPKTQSAIMKPLPTRTRPDEGNHIQIKTSPARRHSRVQTCCLVRVEKD